MRAVVTKMATVLRLVPPADAQKKPDVFVAMKDVYDFLGQYTPRQQDMIMHAVADRIDDERTSGKERQPYEFDDR